MVYGCGYEDFIQEFFLRGGGGGGGERGFARLVLITAFVVTFVYAIVCNKINALLNITRK